MPEYRTTVTWEGGKSCRLSADGRPDLAIGTPPEFGGPEGRWTPEECFIGSIAGCLVSTLLFFAERAKLTLSACTADGAGLMEKTSEGLRFTRVDVRIGVTVADHAEAERARGLRDRLERYCPVSASLRCPVSLELSATTAGETE